MKRNTVKLGLAACGVALFTAATALAQTPAPLPANCVAWWRGEGNANDSVGTNHGAPQDGAFYATGEVGQAFDFRNTNYIVVSDSPSLRFGTGGITIECWLQAPPESRYRDILGKIVRSYPYQAMELRLSPAGKLEFVVTDCGTASCGMGTSILPVVSPDRLDDGALHHIAAVRHATGYELFVDGRSVATRSEVAHNADNSASLVIGNLTPGEDRYRFLGGIDELAIYNRAISSNEIAAIYAAGSAGKVPPQPVPLPTNCVAWWRAENNYLDSIGTNNGTGLNGVTFTNGEVGRGFNFDGNNGYVSVPSASQLNFGANQDFTALAWFKPQQLSSYHFILSKVNVANRASGLSLDSWYLMLDPSTHALSMLFVTNNNNYSIIGNSVPSVGAWSQVAFVRKGANGFLYFNGVQDTNAPAPTGSLSNNDPLIIGALYDTRNTPPVQPGLGAKGWVDEVALFNRALSSNEIAAIYAAGSAGKVVSSGTAPSITSQPQSRTNAFGTTATFTVTATGDAPLSYQWRKGGSPLSNAGNVSGVNTNQLTITNVAFANAGSYNVVVSNLSGSVTSVPVATLTVTQAVAGVSLSGLARTYNGSAQVVSATTTPTGLAYTVTYNGSLAAPTNAGSYAVAATVTDPGYTGGANGTLVIDKATQTIVFGPLPPKVMGDPPFTLNASVGGVTLLSGYSSQNTGVAQVSGNTVTIMGVGSTLITATKAGDANHYAAPDVSQTLVVSGVGASITQPPIAQVVGVGGQATFTVTAAGTGPLHYQWYFNNVAIGGATDSSLTINNATLGAVGTYRVTVWNASGTNTSAAVSLGLDALKMYAGVNAYGPVGSNYVVQFTTNLTAPVTWTPLQSFIIVTNPTVIIDYNSPEQPKRFYRTLPQ